MTWRHLDTGPGEPAFNMGFDEALLESATASASPVLRFYSWTEPAATFGYFQKYAEIAAWTPLRPLIRRTTGGGLVPHEADWTYSLVFPPTHPWYHLRASESYLRLHQWLARALVAADVPAELALVGRKEIPGQCFAGAEQFDVLLSGRKVAGAAQRRAREGLLIQGSVQSLPAGANRANWRTQMLICADATWQVAWEKWSPPASFAERVRELAAAKFSQTSHNQRR